MESGYDILFSLKLTLGGVASDNFSVTPLPDTFLTMRNYAMVFKKVPAGGFVARQYFINELDSVSVVRPLTGIVRFSFLIRLQDPHFLAHADLQNAGQDTGRIGRRIYYFSNLDEHNVIDGAVAGDQGRLSGGTYVSASDLWSILPASKEFPVDGTAYSEVQLYQVRPGAADKQLPSVYTAGAPQAQFVLNGHPPGAFQLRWQGTPARTESIYADNEAVKQNFFGLVEIFKDPGVNAQPPDSNGITYTIPFKHAS